jgi:hypothetical protein
MEVIEELGTDKALEMMQASVEKQANVVANEIRRNIPEILDPIELGIFVYRTFMEEAGAKIQIYEKDEKSVIFAVKRCPFYEAFLDVDINCGYFLGNLCNHLTLPAIQETLTHFYPFLKLEPKLVRQAAEELCLERIYIKET